MTLEAYVTALELRINTPVLNLGMFMPAKWAGLGKGGKSRMLQKGRPHWWWNTECL